MTQCRLVADRPCRICLFKCVYAFQRCSFFDVPSCNVTILKSSFQGHGEAHSWLQAVCPTVERKVPVHNTKFAKGRHSRQILERCKGNFLEMTRRSLFCLLRVYNFLPEKIVQAACVKHFQTSLTEAARDVCRGEGA